MTMLLCTFASQRSSPEKIRRWIAHLEEKRSQHQDDPEAVRTIEHLIRKAQRWAQLD